MIDINAKDSEMIINLFNSQIEAINYGLDMAKNLADKVFEITDEDSEEFKNQSIKLLQEDQKKDRDLLRKFILYFNEAGSRLSERQADEVLKLIRKYLQTDTEISNAKPKEAKFLKDEIDLYNNIIDILTFGSES